MTATHAPDQFCPVIQGCPGHSFLDPAMMLIDGSAWNPELANKHGVPPEELVELVKTSEEGAGTGCYAKITDTKGEQFYVLTLLGQWFLQRAKPN